jgi:hypothetical protein
LPDELLEVAVDVGLELDDGLGGEGVGYDLPLAGVVGAVSGGEDATLDADEGIVERPFEFPMSFRSRLFLGPKDSRLQHAIPMA